MAQFLREYFEAEPVGASFYGLTEWDGLLPDLSAAGFAEREAAAARWLDRFAAWPDSGPTAPGPRAAHRPRPAARPSGSAGGDR